MKRLFCLLLVLILSPVFSLSEYQLSDNEQKYIGSWSMFAQGQSGKIYSFNIVFLDNMTVVQNSLQFENGILAADNKASGEWCGFTGDSIILSLAGTDMCAKIKHDGYLYLYFLRDVTLCGIYSKCEDMTAVLGW